MLKSRTFIYTENGLLGFVWVDKDVWAIRVTKFIVIKPRKATKVIRAIQVNKVNNNTATLNIINRSQGRFHFLPVISFRGRFRFFAPHHW